MDEATHVPVLLAEVMQALEVRPDATIVDATYGRGGHAGEIMKRLDQSGRLLALDRDPQAAQAARQKFADDARVRVEHASFSLLERCCDRHRLSGRVTGVVFDLGVSSPQLDDPRRGFSFRHDGPLDMRMDPGDGTPSAAEWLHTVTEHELADVLHRYGEERYARRIARAIVRRRGERPIETTHDLSHLVARAIPGREAGKDPATRTFQAIRIYLNRELGELEAALPQALRVLAAGGRLAVISFHSLEDRLVKRFLRAESKGPELPRKLPVVASAFRPRLKLLGRAVRAGDDEIRRNPRARSATLRIAERTEVPYA